MNQLAQRLMTLYDKPLASSSSLTAMLGGSTTELPTNLTRVAFRVGLWPIVWAEHPEEGLGIAVLLSHLLERWQEIRVYRLLARIPEDIGTYTWQIDDSNFTPDDWQLEPLDENMALWGEIHADGGQHQLVLLLENDLIDDEDAATRTFSYAFTDLVDLIRQLPKVAEDLAEFIGAVYVREIEPLYEIPEGAAQTPALSVFLTSLFQWELRLQLWLSGRDWEEEAVVRAYDHLKQAAKDANLDAAVWGFAKAAASVVGVPGYQPLGTILVPLIPTAITELNFSRVISPILSSALYASGSPDEAYALLDEEIENHPQNVFAWLTLADLYNQSSRLQDALAVFQDALDEAKLVNRILYFYYANSMLMTERYGLPVSDFVLIPEDEREDNDAVRREVIQAYREALKLENENKHVLYGLVLRLIELNEDEVWQVFPTLVRADTNGDLTRSAIDSMSSMDDLQPAVDTLKSAIARNPERFDLSISLGAVLISAERYDEAAEVLNDVDHQALSPVQHADVEKLLLITDMPDFEGRFAELTALIDARRSPSEDDVDFLEEVVESAPTLTAAHLLLARAYVAWDDRQAALEVLLDAQKELPDDPYILVALADLLWNMGEEATAFQYLNNGLNEHPNHIGLLAKTGLFLFENDQEEQAKRYLSRAEAIDRTDPLLSQIRALIASRISQEPLDGEN